MREDLLDVRGLGCASVLIRLAAHCREQTDSHELVVLTDDLGAPEELPAWCRMTGHRYLGTTNTPNEHRLVLHEKQNALQGD